MLTAMITTALIYFLMQSAGSFASGMTCWGERLSGAGGNSSCMVSQPFLIFSHSKSVYQMGLDGKNHRRLVSGVGTSILLDFHFKEQRLYWADKRKGVIYKASVTGAHRQKLYSFDKHISGLTVDWIWNHVFWTSREKGEIQKMDLNGENNRTVLKHLTLPRSINVDPNKRFLFWLSGGSTSSIQRSDLTGQMKMTLIETAEQVKALSIDREDERLFWVQFGPRGQSAIGSCDYSGNGLHVMDQRLQSPLLGMSVFLEHVYFTDAASRVIKQVNKYTGGQPQVVNRKQMPKPPADIKVVHPLMQPVVDPLSSFSGCEEHGGNCVNVCSRLAEEGVCECSEGFELSKHGTYCEDVNECAHWNHGCSLGCENIPGSYFCTCPKGYALLSDRKTCREITQCKGNVTKCGHGCLELESGAVCVCPEGSILQEDGQTCTGCSSADRGGCSQICTPITPSRWQCGCLPGYQLHQDGKRCIATGPPPFLLVANLVDVRRINPDGTEDQILVTDPRATILALDHDPVLNQVYFVSTSQKTIERVDLSSGSREVLISDGLDSPEGLTVDWVHRRMYWTDKSKSTVEGSTLRGQSKETVVKEGLDKPRGIAVHPQAKKLFWTDVGARPVVECSTVEGNDRVVIASTDLVSPTGLTIDFTDSRLFWCDQRRGLIETAAFDGSDRRVLLENQVGRPFDLAVFEDKLWISDWEHQQLRSVHKRTGRKLQRIHDNMVQPASIVVVHPLAKPDTDVCQNLNGRCAQVCESRLGFAHCSCLPPYILSPDGKSCLPTGGSSRAAESGQGNTTDLMSLKNKTLNDESAPLTTTERTTGKKKSDSSSDGGTEPNVFTEKMISDLNECQSLRCDVNARCQLNAGKAHCVCLEGFTGDGQKCLDLEATSQWVTSRPADDTTRRHDSSSVERCPPSHEAYCLYQGVCFYFPDMDSYACNCVPGYMGERCQFSDLEWLELQRAEKEKRRNTVIAGCMVVILFLLSITACVTYCFRTRRLLHKQASVDDVSEISVTDASTLETSTPSVLRYYMVAENDVDTKIIPSVGCPRRAACSSCSSETDTGPFPEESGTLSKHNRAYECSMESAVATETTQTTSHHSNLPQSSSDVGNFSSVESTSLSQTPSPEPPSS